MKMLLVALAGVAVGLVGGFAIGMSLGPNPPPAEAPAAKTAKSRLSSHVPTASSSSFFDLFSKKRTPSVSVPISAPRTAFMSAAGKDGAIAMTSPVAFICVPSLREEPRSLSNGHLGSFTTT